MNKCSNPDCPYNAETYDQHYGQYHGLCLNCIDDEQKDIMEMEVDAELNFDFA